MSPVGTKVVTYNNRPVACKADEFAHVVWSTDFHCKYIAVHWKCSLQANYYGMITLDLKG